MLGWHLEQAHQLLRELGPIDAQGRALGERAARHLAAAGRRALARDDLTLAASLLGRALARLDVADPARADLALDWCEALLSAGDVATAVRAIDELGRFAHDSDRLRAWHTCFSGQLAVLTDPQGAARHRGRGRGRGRGADARPVTPRARRRPTRCTRSCSRARQDRRVRGGARPGARRSAARARPPSRQRRAGRRAGRRALGTEPGHARQRPLPRRRARAAHHPGRPRGRGRRAALSGRARDAARTRRRGAAHDRVVAAHGRRARHHATRCSRPMSSPG